MRTTLEKEDAFAQAQPKGMRKYLKRAQNRTLSLVLFFVGLVGVDFLLRALYGFAGHTALFAWRPVVFTLCWSAVFTAIAGLLPGLASRIYMIVLGVFFSVLSVAHGFVYQMFGSFFAISDLNYAGDGAKFFSFSYLLGVRKLLILGGFLAIVLFVTAALLMPRKKRKKAWYLVMAATILVSCVGIALVNNTLLGKRVAEEMTWDVVVKEQQPENTTIYEDFVNRNVCLPMVGMYQYTARDIALQLKPANSADRTAAAERIDSYRQSRELSGKNEMTGVLAGKNLIMIMVESLDTWMVTPEFMPNLYALCRQSVQFSHNYSPLYLTGGTFSTEFVSQTGIIPPMSGVSPDRYVANSFPYSLAALFRAKGYRADSFHSCSGAIYNRSAIHKNLHFSDYHSYIEMGMDDPYLDEELLKGYDLYVREAPFYSFIITYSGHGAYDESSADISEKYIDKARAAVAASDVKGSEQTMEAFTQCVAHMMQTDGFIGGLMEKLEADGSLEDTVLILYGDHYSKYITDTEFLMDLKGVPNRNLLCSTPLMIYSSDLQPQTVEKYVSTVDLFPTICNLFALDCDLSAFVGDDAFGSQGGIVYWKDGSWYDGTQYVEDGTTQGLTEQQKRVSDEIRRKLMITQDIFRYDYFSRLK